MNMVICTIFLLTANLMFAFGAVVLLVMKATLLLISLLLVKNKDQANSQAKKSQLI